MTTAFCKKTGKMEKCSWWAVGRDPETGKRVPEYAGLRRGLKKALAKVEQVEIGNVKAKNNESIDFPSGLGDAIEKYKSHMIDGFEEDTRLAYVWAIDKLLLHFGADCPLRDIATPKILSFMDKLLKKQSVNGVRDVTKICSAFFGFCVKRGGLVDNPAKGCLDENVYAEKKADRYYTDDEARTLIKFSVITRPKISDELQDIVRIALNTGLREGEIPVIKTAWIYNGYINLPWEMTKCDKARKVPIHERCLMPIIQKYMSRGTELLIPGWSEQRIQTGWRRSKTKAYKAKAIEGRCRFHDLRHTFASNFLKDGGKIQDLQIILGHADIKTTMRYVHFQEDHTKEPVNNMKNLFMEEAPVQLGVFA